MPHPLGGSAESKQRRLSACIYLRLVLISFVSFTDLPLVKVSKKRGGNAQTPENPRETVHSMRLSTPM